MAETAPASQRFQMVGSRASVLDGPVPDIIEQQIRALEDAIERVPDFAFDLAKTLVETICKTILEDIGRPADPNWDAPQIMRETTTYLSLIPRNQPDPARTRGSIIEDSERPPYRGTGTLRASQQLRHRLPRA